MNFRLLWRRKSWGAWMVCCMDETSCCCTRRHSLIPVLRFQTTSAISGTLLLLTMNHWKRLLSRIHARSWGRLHSGRAQISRKWNLVRIVNCSLWMIFASANAMPCGRYSCRIQCIWLEKQHFPTRRFTNSLFQKKSFSLVIKLFGGHLLRNWLSMRRVTHNILEANILAWMMMM